MLMGAFAFSLSLTKKKKKRTTELADGIRSRNSLEFYHLKKQFFSTEYTKNKKLLWVLKNADSGSYYHLLLIPSIYLIFCCGTQAFDF